MGVFRVFCGIIIINQPKDLPKMAFVTTNTIITAALASANPGHSQATSASALSAVNIRENVTLTIAKVGVVNATPATGFDALITAADTAIQTLISTTWGIDTTGNSVDYLATVYGVRDYEAATDQYRPDASNNFEVDVEVQVRVY